MVSTPPHTRFAVPVAPHASTEKARQRSILVVDEDAASGYAVLDALRSEGHRRVYAASTDVARVLIRDSSFDVILVSLTREGLRFLMEVKRSTNVCLIAMIGGWGYFPVNYQLRIATALGLQGTLRKPVSPQRVRITVEQALSALV